MAKIFYAWQSDRDQDACHYFIRDALKLAIKQIVKADAEPRLQEAARPELDHDRKGVPGTPRIADVIEKKIARAAVFVGDLTAVADFETHDRRKKQTPNANVLIELGMAFKAVKSERIITVMNTAYGPPENLPFDLQGRSHPISYNVISKADSDYKAKLKKLADLLVEPLKLCLNHYVEKVTASATAKQVTAEAERRSRSEAAWKEFTEKLLAGKFRGIEPGPYIAATITPVQPTVDRLDLRKLDRNDLNLHGLTKPIGAGSGWNHDVYGRSYVSHNGREARRDRPAERPTTVTEFFDTGTFHAADIVTIGGRNDDEKCVPLQGEENRLYHVLARYVSLLRSLDVKGPLELRIMLSGVEGAKLLPNNSFYWFERNFRPLVGDIHQTAPIMLGADVNGESVAAIAEAARPEMEIFWKDAGVGRDACFDEAGKFRLAD